jgi:hypothetical protein
MQLVQRSRLVVRAAELSSALPTYAGALIPSMHLLAHRH